MMHAELTFRGLPKSDAVELSVLRWIARLEQLHDRTGPCRVAIDRKRWPGGFEVVVRIDDAELGITTRAKHDNLYVAIADAFRALRRQLVTPPLLHAS